MEKTIEGILGNYISKVIGMEYERFKTILEQRDYEVKIFSQATAEVKELIQERVEKMKHGTICRCQYDQALTDIINIIEKL